MSNAYVLMTAMPPTKGHLALIDFAQRLIPSGDFVYVVLCTQPSEPFAGERFLSLRKACKQWHNVHVMPYHKEISQDASKPEFWDMWKGIMLNFGMTKNDIIVSSEPYGQKVADLFGAEFVPYDPDRDLQKIKATNVREHPIGLFDQMIPEFQKYLRKTITVFGAESVGKTTVSSKMFGPMWNTTKHWRMEWARPYLEMVGPEVTDRKMHVIFKGQEAIQQQGQDLVDRPFIIQDTDLYSTIGYWELWKGERAPEDWYFRAAALKSDLYIILSQNIPFEADPLRYGGDKRETPDQFWINLCEREHLPYVVIDEDGNYTERLFSAEDAAEEVFLATAKPLMDYKRKHNG